jgi:hypothetical protein
LRSWLSAHYDKPSKACCISVRWLSAVLAPHDNTAEFETALSRKIMNRPVGFILERAVIVPSWLHDVLDLEL